MVFVEGVVPREVGGAGHLAGAVVFCNGGAGGLGIALAGAAPVGVVVVNNGRLDAEGVAATSVLSSFAHRPHFPGNMHILWVTCILMLCKFPGNMHRCGSESLSRDASGRPPRPLRAPAQALLS